MKKFLSLVLALVMAMSLVTVSAGAKDFTDDDSITYDEAVAVISEIGVVDGYKAGDFKPTEVLTRGAAAKIICNLILGPTTASALSASSAPFKDVPVSNVFAGYITYCSQLGIINGYSDGTFRPTGTLTGNAFMKMLLGALGYDSEVEGYTGANWNVAVMKQAVGLGLDDGNDEFVGTKAVTREEAALYAFNMLQATVVEYDAKTTVNVNGAIVTIAGDKPQDKNWGTATNNDGTIAGDGFVQFGEEYFPDLVLSDNNHDDFQRPANVWYFKGVKVGTFAKTADVTYTKDVTLGTIYSDLGMSSKDDEVEVYVDGAQADELAEVSKGNDLKVSEVVFDNTLPVGNALRGCQVGNGTQIEAFLNTKNNTVTIVAINTYVAEVNKVVAAAGDKDAYITLSELGAEKGVAFESGLQANDEYETDEFASDDIVLFTFADGDIQSVVAAESVTGTLNKRVLTKSVTLGETDYSYSNKYSVENGENSLSVGSDYEVYLDEAGYAIYVEESEYNIQDYAFLRALESGNTAFGSDRAALRDYMGKGATVSLNRDYWTEVADFADYRTNDWDGATVADEAGIGEDDALIVLAREASNGKTRLKALATDNYENAAANAAGYIMRNGVATMTMAGNTYYADDRTQVVVGTIDAVTDALTWHAYTGANNMPTIQQTAVAASIDISVYCRNGNIATIMYVLVDEADYAVTAGNNDVLFLSPISASKHTDNGSNTYYSYKAVLNGEITTVDVDDSLFVYSAYPTFNANGAPITYTDLAFTEIDYDDGVIVDWDTILDNGTDGAGIARGVNKLSNGNLQLGYNAFLNTYGTVGTYVVSKDVEVYFIDDDGNITEGTLSSVRRSDEDIVTYVLKDGQITDLFVQQFFDDDSHGTLPVVPPTAVTAVTVAGANGTALTATLTGATNGMTYPVSVSAIKDGVRMDLGSYNLTVAGGAVTIPVTCATGWSYTVTCGNVFGSLAL